MRALSLIPGKAGSLAWSDFPEPEESDGPVLVRTLAIGVCGTDLELARGDYGEAPGGSERLVIGHESLGEVVSAEGVPGLSKGDLVVGFVRRADPVPCVSCSIGEWDMCRNGQYTERGIKGRHGYASERYRIHPEHLIKVAPSLGQLGVLLEPTSVVAKAWEQIERIGSRAVFAPRKILVTGAGPIGLLAALLGVQRGLDVHVLDRVDSGPKPDLVRALGATYHHGSVAESGKGADVVIECTGAPQLVFDAMETTAANGIVCLTGVSSGGRTLGVDVGAYNRSMVLENDVVFGSVNANRRHYHDAAIALAAADHAVLARLVSRRVPPSRFQEAFTRQPDDVKVILDFTA